MWLRFPVALALALTLLPVASAAAPLVDDPVFGDSFEAPKIGLHGVVSFPTPLAFANVVLTGSSGQTQTSTTDADGRFEFTLQVREAHEVFDVRARGIGAQSWLELAAWLGDGAYIRETAGPDNLVDATDLPALHVNPHQTGIYLAIRDLPPSPIAVDRPARRAATSFSSTDATKRGALVALLAEGGAALPPGAATTLQALGELPLAIQVVDSLEGGELICFVNQPESPQCIAFARVLRDTAQVPFTSPPVDAWTHPYTSFEVGVNFNYPRLFLGAAGDGQLQWTNGNRAPSIPIRWSTLVTGEVRVVHRDGLPLYSFLISGLHSSCGCLVWREVATMAVRAHYVRGPMGTLTFGVVNENEYRYPYNPEIPPEIAPQIPLSRLTQAVVDDRPLHAIPIFPGDLWVLPHCTSVYCQSVEGVESAETHLFRFDGTGIARQTQLNFDWSMSALGQLLIQYENGTQTKHMLASADRVPVTSASVQMGANGDVVALSQPIMRAQDRVFEPVDVIGFSFDPNRGCQRPFAEIEINCRSTGAYSFAAGGSGSGFNNALSWSIDAQGRLVFLRFRQNGSLASRRVWERVAEVGDTLYVLERVHYPPLPDIDARKSGNLMVFRKAPVN